MGESVWSACSVLIVGDAAADRDRLSRELAPYFGLVEVAADQETAGALMDRCRFDALIAATGPRSERLLEWLGELDRSSAPGCLIVASTRLERDQIPAVERARPSAVLTGPWKSGELMTALDRHLGSGGAAPRPVRAERGALSAGARRDVLVGESAAVREVRETIRQMAPLPATVLIEGETGTGKELVARLLHRLSGRAGGFVPVNCGAIAPELLESELFGHTKGAFTSAHSGREGLFLAAHRGTLFLDEISEMPMDMEVKLLRALEEGAVRPVGADREARVDIRVVTSTQHELSRRVDEGRFRKDLYYRINVVRIPLPPLRRRRDDIPLLAGFFMEKISRQLGLPAVHLGPDAMNTLRAHPWPGNVRELRNVIERCVLMGRLPEDCFRPDAGDDRPLPVDYPLDWTLEQVKLHHMERVLEASDGNKSAAARRLGISRKTLERKLGVDADDARDIQRSKSA